MQNDAPTEEIRATVRRFMARHSGVDEIRKRLDATEPGAGSFDAATWRRLVDELGFAAIAVPEEAGGLGLGVSTMAAVLEEVGRDLYPGPALSVALAVEALRVLHEAGLADVLDPFLARIAAGELLPVLAVAPDYRDRGCGATITAGGLRGAALAVPDGAVAELLVALCLDASGTPALAVVDLSDLAPGQRVPVSGLDLARARADLDLDGLTVTAVCTDPAVLRRVTDRVQVLAAAEQLGLARGCLARTLEYLGIREQFGRIIGSYQALQHRCADLAVAIESVAALVDVAAAAADTGDEPLLTRTALLARARAGEVSVAAATAMIQLHGGIGFTWEHPAHLFFRHAHAAATWFGGPDDLYEEAVRRGCFSLVTRELAS